MKLTTRRKFLEAAALLPTAAIGTEPRYDPFKCCGSDDILEYGTFGIVIIGAQSIDPFEIRATSMYIESEWRSCEICGNAYFKNDRYNVFEQGWTRVGGNAIRDGIKLAIPSNESAIVRIHRRTAEPPYEELVRAFKPEFDSKLHCKVFI